MPETDVRVLPVTHTHQTLQDIARRVRKLAQLPDGNARFGTAIKSVLGAYKRRSKKCRDFDKRRHYYFAQKVAQEKRLQDEKAGPPKTGWKYELGPAGVTPINEGLQRNERSWGWTPTKLLKRNRPEHEPLIPLSGRKLTPDEELTVLAIVTDREFRGKKDQFIGPFDKSMAYTVWVETDGELSSVADMILLNEFLDRAMGDTTSGSPTSEGGGVGCGGQPDKAEPVGTDHPAPESYHDIRGYVPADTLHQDYGITPQRLSEAARRGDVSTKPAPRGTKSEGKSIRLVYNEEQARKHCEPQRLKQKVATTPKEP